MKNISVYRLSLVKEKSLPYKTDPKVQNAAEVADLVRTYLKGVDREHLIVLFLDTRNKVIGINTVSVGTLNESIIHPREVFKGAILANANAIICAHNHPSGETDPSDEDKETTRRLVGAGNLLGIPVLDHVIVGEEGYTSFANLGLI